MRVLRLTGGLLLAALGIVLLLAAVSVRDAGRALDRADLAADANPRQLHPVQLGGPLPDALPRWLLGLDDDLALRRAERDWQLARGVAASPSVSSAQASAEAQASLAPFSQDEGSPGRVTFAATRLGVLAFDARPAGGGGGPSNEESAETAFKQAVDIDPAADDAAFDLELLLRDTQANGQQNRPGSQSNGQGKGRHGAGSSTEGHGY
jgi:hypothetical protein